MTYLLERARDLKAPVTLTLRVYPEQAVETVALSVRVGDGTLEWRSDPVARGGVEAVVGLAKMMGGEVCAC